MESLPEGAPRTYRIKRSQHLGYGFIVGYEQPTMVKAIESNGPSFKRLLHGDVIMAVNGIDVEHAPREQIIKMIQLSEEEINIKVRQATYEEIIRAKNLADPKFYMINKSPITQHTDNFSTQRKLPTPLSSPASSYTPVNHLFTSVTQQHDHSLYSTGSDQDIQQVHMPRESKSVLKQLSDDNGTSTNGDSNNNFLFNGANILGRNHNVSHPKYGRHSPLPQRCKSSMSVSNNGKTPGEDDNDQPMLKRSNTMRIIRAPAKVMEIFEVVIRIFFEDGHTRVLNYNQDTTVAAILETLNNRFVGGSSSYQNIKRYFGLALTVNSEDNAREQQMSKKKLLHILDGNDSIMKIRQLPYAPKLRLLYRMIFPPADVNKLYSQDKVAFEYLYKQSCNDLRLERFRPELDSPNALKLAALHLVEYVYSNHPKAHGNHKDPKFYMKLIKKTPGVEHFVPASMVEATKDKKGKRIEASYKRLRTKMSQQLKANFDEFDFEPPKVRATTNLQRYTSTSFHELSLPELQSSPSEYVKLLFLNYLSQLTCYSDTKRPIRTSTSPVEQTSLGDCSSSIESVPQTSDSSPLLKTYHSQPSSNNHHNRMDNTSLNTISRLAQVNSMHSLSSSTTQPPSGLAGQSNDEVDIIQTPSIESISSITFNMQSSPSPQQTSSHTSQQSESFILVTQKKQNAIEPCPMPRQQSYLSKIQSLNSAEKIYSHRNVYNGKPIDELLKNAILLPPPPASPILQEGLQSSAVRLPPLTPVLTDRDLEGLKVPPPPKIGGNQIF